MGQHTWFLKSRELYLKQEELYDRLDKFEADEIYLDTSELHQIHTEIDENDEMNDAGYVDLFRTGKRNEDNSYIDEVILTREDCFKWIDNPDNLVSFTNREFSINKLNEFWDKYPDGVIYFG